MHRPARVGSIRMQRVFGGKALTPLGGFGRRVENVGPDHHDQLAALSIGRLSPEQEADFGQVPKDRDLVTGVGDLFFDQAAKRDGQYRPVRQRSR